MQPTNDQPQPHEQALRELAQRCEQYVRDGLATSADLARALNGLHVLIVSYPREPQRWQA